MNLFCDNYTEYKIIVLLSLNLTYYVILSYEQIFNLAIYIAVLNYNII